MRALTAYQLASLVVQHGFRKFRTARTQSKEFRYFVKDLTEAEWSVFEDGEDLTDEEVEARIEPGGWVILDAFSASGVKQIYEALGPESRAKFDRIHFSRLVEFAFKHCMEKAA